MANKNIPNPVHLPDPLTVLLITPVFQPRAWTYAQSTLGMRSPQNLCTYSPLDLDHSSR